MKEVKLTKASTPDGQYYQGIHDSVPSKIMGKGWDRLTSFLYQNVRISVNERILRGIYRGIIE